MTLLAIQTGMLALQKMRERNEQKASRFDFQRTPLKAAPVWPLQFEMDSLHAGR